MNQVTVQGGWSGVTVSGHAHCGLEVLKHPLELAERLAEMLVKELAGEVYEGLHEIIDFARIKHHGRVH